MFNVEADDRAGHDRGNTRIGPVSAAAESGVQAMPARCAHGPIAWVYADRDFIGSGPGGRLDSFTSLAVTERTPLLAGAVVGSVQKTRSSRIRTTRYAATPDAVGQRGFAVAGIKHEHRHLLGVAEPAG